ncbi:MAG TPA: RNA methyltransferase [Usitatibacter sp.]|nr:RNA methyltransferase [Usitatibacter sp.]
MKAVTSRENAAYKAAAKLVASAAERRKRGLSVLDGTHLLAALLDSGRVPEELFIDARGAADGEVRRLVERSSPARVTLLADALFNAISTVDSPTGVISLVRTPGPAKAPPDAPLVLLLDGIQDPGNVGTLLRSAAAAGATHAMLSPACAFAWSPKVLRAAMGAHFALGIVEGADLAAYVGAYRGTSIALAAHARASLYDVDLTGPCALIVGSEGAGLTPSLEAAAKVRAGIPMPGRMESLNAATAGSLALFECVRQRATRTKGAGR